MSSHSEVAHNWANKTGKAKKGFNVFYEDGYRGNVIYSYGYHFPIARHATLPNGKEAVFMTTRGYSVSTGSHISQVSSAISHLNVIRMDNIEASNKREHTENYKLILKDRIEVLSKATRARTYKDMYVREAEGLRNTLNKYSKLFKLGFHDIKEVSIDEFEGVVKEFDLNQIAKRKSEQRKKERLRKSRLEEAKLHMREWHHNTRSQCPYIEGYHDQVRIKGDIVETSKGVKVKLSDGLKLFKLMEICAGRKELWIPKTEMKIDGFKVTCIESDGMLRVACHTITLKAAQIALKIARVEV